MNFEQWAIEVAQSPKTGAVVSASAAGSAWATILEIIPVGIGILSALASLVLVGLLIKVQLLKIRRERLGIETDSIELSTLKANEADRCARARQRREAGVPVRRSDDA
jgi:beta-lactamase regulating signal transducer with metallopeptidase domain